ncbi:MAG: DNA replication and repair protein RecF [Bdellovibrionales bacterium]|nr:DNA replication and repair protein RecF [Bdellovibrionales bacterium]
MRRYAYEDVMFVEKLEVHCFRNYSYLCFFPALKSLIVGDNGQGKTNLLEALVLLAYGRSFRASYLGSLVQEGKDAASILAWVSDEGKKSNLRLCLNKKEQRKFWVNNKRRASSSMGAELPLIVFSPESLKLLKGAAEHRRYWIDAWLSLCGQAPIVEAFKKALIQKNKLLKQAQKGDFSLQRARTWLESVNEVFMEKSLALAQARMQAVQDLSLFLEESGAILFKGSKKELEEVKGSYSLKGWDGKTEQSVFLRKKLEESFFQEQAVGTSLYGAHRDDLTFFFKGRDSRYFCSQGQQRALVLALKIAQSLWLHRVRKKGCLMLLDDVFSEIDKHVVFSLLHFLDKIPSQTILTSTKNTALLRKMSFQVFNLKEGLLRKDILSERKSPTLGEASI